MPSDATLQELRSAFVGGRRFFALPFAGAFGWTLAGVLGAILPTFPAALALFFCTGMTFPLGLLIARFTGENLMDRESELGRLMGLNVVMASLVWGIAIPFFMIEPSSLPLSVGILAGLMWVPFSWILQHWIGIFHGVARTILVVAAWYVFPAQRFVIIPAVIVSVYLVTIIVLARRPASRANVSRA